MDEQKIVFQVVLFGTLFISFCVIGFLFFIYLYQKKLSEKKQEFLAIEHLLRQTETQATYQAIEAQDEERKKIAQEVHDNLSSVLATISMLSSTLHQRILSNSNDLHPLSEQLQSLSQTALSTVREVAHSLDSGTIRLFGLRAAIEQLCEAIDLSGRVKVYQELDLPIDVPKDITIQVYRIIQELFTNALKHSMASTVHLHITVIRDQSLSIIFQDNGKGMEATVSEGLGLKNIRQRVEKYQGTFSIQSKPSLGTTAIVELPLPGTYYEGHLYHSG
jgi:signal transduction histidine kinase